MKLLRVGEVGKERPAVLDPEGRIRDLLGVLPGFTAKMIEDGLEKRLAGIDLSLLPEVSAGTRIGPCIEDSGRVFCVGLNYSDHAHESNLPIPDQPIVFMKVCDRSGPNDDIVRPKGSTKLDWEVELGVIIGKPTQHVSREEALQHVAGYCVVHDVSERAFQNEFGGQWVKGKSCDTFCPIGPYFVTADEVPNPQDLELFLDVNGSRRQSGHTGTMIFDVAELVSHLSRFISLRPGDLIATGTPPGVGMGMSPQQFLAPGDTVSLGISGLGEQRQRVVQFPHT